MTGQENMQDAAALYAHTERNPATTINASWAQSGSLAYFMCALLSHLLG